MQTYQARGKNYQFGEAPVTGFDEIINNVGKLGLSMQLQLENAAEEVGQYFESYAKENKPWTDRTGFLKNSIKSSVSANEDGVTIVLSESMFYAPFVEAGTSHNKPYPILWPTIINNQAEVIKMLQDTVKVIP